MNGYRRGSIKYVHIKLKIKNSVGRNDTSMWRRLLRLAWLFGSIVLDAETGQVLEYIAAHKTETGSSGKLEVCNEAAQRVVAVKY